jgi:long-chain acyl-CoA synthetase
MRCIEFQEKGTGVEVNRLQGMNKIDRIFDLLELYRDEFKSKPDAFSCKKDGAWVNYSSSDYIKYSDLISLGLLSLGVKKGDRIATIMVNCPEWNFFDMGIMQAGAVQVPVYPTISGDNYRFILKDAGIEYLIVSNQEIYERVKNVARECESIKEIFSIERIPGVRNWREILELGRNFTHPEQLEEIKGGITPSDIVSLIYTSGTTGRPKGVMLSHSNFVSNFKSLATIHTLEPGYRAMSFLPLCHVYERTTNYVYQSYGIAIFYVHHIELLTECILDIKPHVFATVPRVMEKIYNRIVIKGRSLPLPAKIIFFWALRQGHKFEMDQRNGWFYNVKLFIANLLIFSKWRKALGGKIKFIVCGSASLHPRLTRIFWAAGMPVYEAYGLTETSPGISSNHRGKGGTRFGTVGPVLSGVQVRIAADGEILVNGPNVMIGYLNRPEKTSEVIDEEGWFHTGDIGVLENDTFLRITDRKKETFKLSTGKFIAPQPIEQVLKESPFIEYIMVMGENRQCTAALIVPNFEHLKSWCSVKHIGFVSKEKVILNPRIIRRFRTEVERFNQEFGQTEKIKKFRLIADEWSMESGELSPTLKLRRKFILSKYDQVIEETYLSAEFNSLIHCTPSPSGEGDGG